MELQNLDQQLKVAIQNHQVLVTKMKTDPQNGALQKQLHELQSQIKGLSEKQKQVVQQLRKDLEIKQQAAAIVVTTTITTTTLSTTQSTNNITLAPPPTTTTTSPMNFQSNKNTQNLIKVLPQARAQSSPLSLTTKRPEVVVRGPSKGITVSAAIILPNKVSISAAAPTTAVVTANGNGSHIRPPPPPLTPTLLSVPIPLNPLPPPPPPPLLSNPNPPPHLLSITSSATVSAPTIILRAVNSTTSSPSPLIVTSTNSVTPIRVPQYPPTTTTTIITTGRNVTTTAFVHLNTQRSPLVTSLAASATTTATATTPITFVAAAAASLPVLLPSKPLTSSSPSSSSSLLPLSLPSTTPLLLTSIAASPTPLILLPSTTALPVLVSTPAPPHPPPPPSSNSSLPSNETKRSLEETPMTPCLEPKLTDADSMKSNFMAALGLITHDTLTELQSRRSERKRRTTANPQFSYGGNWEHPDRKCNTNYLSGSLPPGFKRPRGRPRIGSSTTQTGSRPSTPEDILRNGTLNGLQSLCNGILVKDSDCCVICREKGNEDVQLVCDNCSHAYHRRCLNSQTKDTNEQNETEESRLQDLEGGGGKSWNCPKCLNKKKRLQEWPSSLAVVHSYLAHKATKEEEKRKLLKRSTELKTERNQLQERAKQLGDAISQHVQKRSDIMANTKETMESIDRIKNAIRVLQAS